MTSPCRVTHRVAGPLACSLRAHKGQTVEPRVGLAAQAHWAGSWRRRRGQGKAPTREASCRCLRIVLGGQDKTRQVSKRRGQDFG